MNGEDILSWPVKEAVTRGSGGWVRQISESVIPRARKRQRTRNCQEQIKPHSDIVNLNQYQKWIWRQHKNKNSLQVCIFILSY